jgi:hypothetical protein
MDTKDIQLELDRLDGKCKWLQRQNDDLVAKNKSLKRIMHVYHGLYQRQIELQREQIERLSNIQIYMKVTENLFVKDF